MKSRISNRQNTYTEDHENFFFLFKLKDEELLSVTSGRPKSKNETYDANEFYRDSPSKMLSYVDRSNVVDISRDFNSPGNVGKKSFFGDYMTFKNPKNLVHYEVKKEVNGIFYRFYEFNEDWQVKEYAEAKVKHLNEKMFNSF